MIEHKFDDYLTLHCPFAQPPTHIMALPETIGEPTPRPASMNPVFCKIDRCETSGETPARRGEVGRPKTRPHDAENVPSDRKKNSVRRKRSRSSVRRSASSTKNAPLSEITNLMNSIDLNSSTKNQQVDAITPADAVEEGEEEVEDVRDECMEDLDNGTDSLSLSDDKNDAQLSQITPGPSEHVLEAHPFDNNYSQSGKEPSPKRRRLSVNLTAAKHWNRLGTWLRRRTCSGSHPKSKLLRNQTKDNNPIKNGDGMSMNVANPPEGPESKCAMNIKSKKHSDSLRKQKHDLQASGANPGISGGVSANGREIMVHRIVMAHDLLRLTPVSLHTAVAYFDAALSDPKISRNGMDLVAACCLFIAANRKEVFAPSVYKYVEMFNYSFSATDLTGMELWLVQELPRRYGVVTPYTCLTGFLNLLASRKALDPHFEHVAYYAIEVTLGDQDYKRFPPSHLAVSAICFAASSTSYSLSWEDIQQFGFGSFSMFDITDCFFYISGRIYYDLENEDPDKQEVKIKYSQLKHGRITVGARRAEMLKSKPFSELAWPW